MDLPYTYTDPDGDQLRITREVPRITVVQEAEDFAPITAQVVAPKGADAVAMARAILAASGDTGHEVARTDEIDAYRARGFELTCEVRQLRQQRSDLRRERDAAFEEGARSMREQAADTVARRWPRLTDKSPDALKCADVMDGIRALPLLPDDTRVADVHVATPEGITPCGRGHHDVNTTAIISHANCLECLRALAQVNGTSLVEDEKPPARSPLTADTDT